MNITDIIRKLFDGKTGQVLTDSPGAGVFDPIMRLRPMIGDGNAPQYFLDMQQVSRASVTGGGVIPRFAPPRTINNAPLDFAMQVIGGANSGTLVDSRTLDPLLTSFVLEDRI